MNTNNLEYKTADETDYSNDEMTEEQYNKLRKKLQRAVKKKLSRAEWSIIDAPEFSSTEEFIQHFINLGQQPVSKNQPTVCLHICPDIDVMYTDFLVAFSEYADLRDTWTLICDLGNRIIIKSPARNGFTIKDPENGEEHKSNFTIMDLEDEDEQYYASLVNIFRGVPLNLVLKNFRDNWLPPFCRNTYCHDHILIVTASSEGVQI